MGSAFVVKAPPDGHTLLQCNIASNAIAMSLFAKLPYDQLRDLAPVTLIGQTPNVLAVHPSVPLGTVKEYIAYARANPGKLSYAAGTGWHLAASVDGVVQAAGEDRRCAHPVQDRSAQGITDTIGGQVPSGIFNSPASVAPVQSGRLRRLAVTSVKRIRSFRRCRRCRSQACATTRSIHGHGVCAPARHAGGVAR